MVLLRLSYEVSDGELTDTVETDHYGQQPA